MLRPPVGSKAGRSPSSTIAALEEMLPEETSKDLPSVGVNYTTGDNDEIGFVNGLTGEVVAKYGGLVRGQPGYFIRASREALRAFLWQANDLPVSSNKAFVRYEEDSDGVTAFFKDGSSARGSLLVGSDGLHSRVLSQLLGASKHQPVQSQYVPIFGEVDLPKEQYEPLRDIASAVILSAAPELRQQIGMLHMDEDRSKARFFWAFMPRCADPETFAAWVEKASSQELYDYVMQSSKKLHPSMTKLMEYGGPEALIHPQPKFLEFVTPEDMPTGRVTVLGDAAHGMIPFRGAGANTAILDGRDLARLLVKAHQDKVDFASIVPSYLKEMIPRGREAVLSSRAAGGADGDDPAVHFSKFRPDKKQ